MLETQSGLVHVLTGNGKGKTTAALGMALRALGQGLRVCIIHFMKGTYPYGEQLAMARFPEVKVGRFGQPGFVDPQAVTPQDIAEAQRALEATREAVSGGDHDLVIADEINVATAWGLLRLEEVLQLISDKPADVELVLTGRYADPRVIEVADLVTEMVEIKHPYKRGIRARRGFEY